MKESRIQWVYVASLVVSGAILVQMLLYALQHLFRWKPLFTIFDLCMILFKHLHVPAPVAFLAINVLILYTLGTLIWLTIRHTLDTWKARKIVEMSEETSLTEQYREQFQLAPRDLKIIAYDAPIAMTVGLWKPRILLSTGLIEMLEPNELKAVIEHEKCHMQHRDPLVSLLISGISKAMWYIPIFAWLAEKYPIMIELRADKYAVTQMKQSLDLGSALLKLLKQVPKPHLISLSHASFAETSMNVRIQHILDPHMQLSLHWPHIRIVASLVIIILLMGLI
ncbi:cell surface protein [Paenibacillus marchantiophytorum]|uniref:Cell surface protein n=1 Tax=Paenibacillus marchantiophytorum TaxID=1619310 RepID=A0ABQ1ETE3_9BACL|nr:M56 family metallopeptidase [Paenibacillus marchantiophytorum]GFZ85315.1 cell surface protein [Paenibacillus marchantiophytorum]